MREGRPRWGGLRKADLSREVRQTRETLPALMHEVHTLSFFGVLPTIARTVWMLGFQRRLVRRCECELEWPKPGPLPQTSQLAATFVVLTSRSDVALGH